MVARKYVRWRRDMAPLWTLRMKLFRWRREKWIEEIVRMSLINFDKVEMFDEREIVYVWVNVINKRKYIGE